MGRIKDAASKGDSDTVKALTSARKNRPTEVTATDKYGSQYITQGKNSKEAGRSMAYHIATGMVPSGSHVAQTNRNLGRQFH